MPDVHDIAAGASAGVDEEGLLSLMLVEDQVEITVRKDDASAKEAVQLMPSNSLKSGQQCIIDELRPELVDEFIVVDWLHRAVFSDLARYAPGIDILAVRNDATILGLIHRFGRLEWGDRNGITGASGEAG
jgi:hypothetical protein